MYHIPDDKRSIKSADLIGKGMIQLLKKEPFEKISILSIHNETGVSRATFYRLFDRVEDVLEYLCDTIFNEIGQELSEYKEATPKELLISFINKWLEKDVLLECLSKNRMMNILCSAHLKQSELVYAMLKMKQPIEKEQLDYICYMLSYLMAMAFDVWAIHGKKENANMLYEHFISSYKFVAKLFE